MFAFETFPPEHQETENFTPKVLIVYDKVSFDFQNTNFMCASLAQSISSRSLGIHCDYSFLSRSLSALNEKHLLSYRDVWHATSFTRAHMTNRFPPYILLRRYDSVKVFDCSKVDSYVSRFLLCLNDIFTQSLVIRSEGLTNYCNLSARNFLGLTPTYGI